MSQKSYGLGYRRGYKAGLKDLNQFVKKACMYGQQIERRKQEKESRSENIVIGAICLFIGGAVTKAAQDFWD